MSFDMYIHPWNHGHNQDTEHIHHPQNFAYVPL